MKAADTIAILLATWSRPLRNKVVGSLGFTRDYDRHVQPSVHFFSFAVAFLEEPCIMGQLQLSHGCGDILPKNERKTHNWNGSLQSDRLGKAVPKLATADSCHHCLAGWDWLKPNRRWSASVVEIQFQVMFGQLFLFVFLKSYVCCRIWWKHTFAGDRSQECNEQEFPFLASIYPGW